MKRALWVIVAGCGRLHFDPIGTAGDSAAPGDSAPACVAAAEACNGIDDDCDGLVDEGCPCVPFSKTVPSLGLFNLTVSDGVGWIASDFTTLYRIDPAGTVSVIGPDPAMRNDGPLRQVAAWTGTEVARLDASDALAFFSPAGQLVHRGSALQTAGSTILRRTGSGFEVAFGFNNFTYVITDAGGNELARTGATTAGTPVPEGLLTRNGSTVVVAMVGPQGEYAVADPSAPLAFQALNQDASFASVASDGTRAVIASSAIELLDDNGLSPLTLPLGGFALVDIAWTGNGWDVVTTNGLSANPVILRRVHLDSSFAMVSSTDIVSIPNTTSIASGLPMLVTDARRSLIQWSVAVGGGPNTEYLDLSCH